jgi:hypothetical protein
MDDRSRQTIWLVTSPGAGSVPGPYIPTLGHPTSASDLFRVVGIHATGHENWNSCFTDFTAPASLARLIEGEVRSVDDLQAAEIALQALMWHERVDILVPGFRTSHQNFAGYTRESDPRTQVAFDLFSAAAAYDHIFAVEDVEVAAGVVRESNLKGSGVTGLPIEQAKAEYLSRSPFQAAALSEIPIHFGVPAYFAHPNLRPYSGKRGFFGEFYTSVSRQWDEAIRVVPDIHEVIAVPPLVAIVLDRAANRSELPTTILNLRAELAPVRTEMLRFSEMVRGAYNQVQVEAQCKDIRASFEAAFKASRRKDQSFLLPLLKLYKAIKSPLDPLISALNPDYEPGDPRVVADRTVTARTFARLLKVDAMHSLLTNMLSESEMRSLEQSASRRPEA